MEVMVYSENEKLFKELVSAAIHLNASKVTAAVIGTNEDAEKAAKLTDKVLFVEASQVGEYRPKEYAEALFQIVKASDPQVLLIGGTHKGNAIAAMLSVMLGEPSVTEVSDLKITEEGLMVLRSAFGGVAVAEVRVGRKLFTKVASPKVACLKPGFFPPAEEEKNGSVEKVSVDIKSTAEVLEVKEKEKGVGLEDADIVVVAGRGVKKKEDLSLVEELAKALGGVMGVTRPLSADLHWMPVWVGMSGIAVKPKLYVGVGVSGQIQHVAGIRNSKVIVAINIDQNAPIFEHADYGIVGDLYQVVPKLVEMLKT
ncbi:MAG: electron transfer flavoprotein subunit alpha/FixB family protein [Archaeoglobus sp.]|nr:electron transfer flavoprotein subunit alpha/FixB family protein [Archaeoglobus sp.]